jgi:hypothetical protein
MQYYAKNVLSVKYTHSKYFVVAKTCQKSPKNPTAKNPAKIFYDYLNKKPAKNP